VGLARERIACAQLPKEDELEFEDFVSGEIHWIEV
jgi:hypothetical protein